MSNENRRVFEFGPYRVEVDKRLLTRDGRAVALQPKTFDLLLLLLEGEGRVLTKSELLRSLWPDTFVEDGNLAFQISTLRKALGENSGYAIETVPKHGNRFCGLVTSGTCVQRDTRRSTMLRPGQRWALLTGTILTAVALVLWKYGIREPT